MCVWEAGRLCKGEGERGGERQSAVEQRGLVTRALCARLQTLAHCCVHPFTLFLAHPLTLSRTRDMDMVLTELASALPVDVMPGAEDPTNVALPQQPLHRFVREGGYVSGV